MRDLVRHLIEVLDRNREPIICQVVETRGSTPQKAGSMMIIDPEGAQVGTLGGGCVENEVKQKAIRHIGGETATVHSFVLDHDYAWADGLICGGKMVILTQPLSRLSRPAALDYFRTLDRVIEEGRGFTEAVTVDTERANGVATGTRFLFDGEGLPRASWPAAEAPAGMAGHIVSPLDRPSPSVHEGVAYLPQWPRIRLIVVGAGHVGQAVANLAAQADFDVWVVDDRHQYANRDRLPAAARDRSPHLRAHRDPRPRPRPGGPFPPGADPCVVRRLDRQPAQDPPDF
jgi:xanthine dehydrogenase accessory factor